MKSPSELGLAIEAAVAANPKFKKYREPVQYLCFFRTSTGRAFAFERVTISQITLWLPEDERVRAAAEAIGAPITKSVPFPNERNTYGRISSLRIEPQLESASLYRVAVTSVGEALAVLESLS